jgi:hypothetical protein
MQFRLCTAMVLLATAPPALAWAWSNRAEIALFAPLLAFVPIIAATVVLVVLDNEDV